MVKMQVRHKYVRNIILMIAQTPKGAFQTMVAPAVVMAKKLFRLFVSKTRIHKEKSVTVLYQEASGANVNEVVGICRVGTLP
jgi:hypothetical protein